MPWLYTSELCVIWMKIKLFNLPKMYLEHDIGPTSDSLTVGASVLAFFIFLTPGNETRKVSLPSSYLFKLVLRPQRTLKFVAFHLPILQCNKLFSLIYVKI